jgi:predicted neuraminidase
MAYPTGLPNNNSGIETVQDDQTLFLVCNPVGANWGARFPLVILRSDDDGKTFRTVKTLEPEREEAYIEAVLAQGAREGYHVKVEYSYPAAMVRGGRMYVTYTYHRRSIAFWEIPLEELK